jgi:hypothetical protein
MSRTHNNESGMNLEIRSKVKTQEEVCLQSTTFFYSSLSSCFIHVTAPTTLNNVAATITAQVIKLFTIALNEYIITLNLSIRYNILPVFVVLSYK